MDIVLETRHTKDEILQAYLNQVYLGHMDGVAIHGYGAGARAYFGKEAGDLTLSEASLLAAIVQGPNRLHPVRHPDRARSRRDLVLARMEAEGWAEEDAIAAALASGLGLKPAEVQALGPRYFLSYATAVAGDRTGRTFDNGRGVRIETSLDPLLQQEAEQTVAAGLRRLRKNHRQLRSGGLSAALVALHAGTGEVLAYVWYSLLIRSGADEYRDQRTKLTTAMTPVQISEAERQLADWAPGQCERNLFPDIATGLHNFADDTQTGLEGLSEKKRCIP